MRVQNFLEERVVRGDEYSRVECALRKGCGANEKYIMTGEAALKCRRRGSGQSMRDQSEKEKGGRWLVDEEGVKCDNLRGRVVVIAQTVNPLPFNYA